MNKFFVAISAILLLAGCDRTPRTAPLEVNPGYIMAPMEGGSFHIEVSGPAEWVTDNTARWVSISKHGNIAKVDISANSEGERTRNIRFHCEKSQAFLTISQERSDIFTVSPLSIHSGYRGGTFTLDIECYEEWETEIPADWLAVSPSQGCGPGSVTVSVSQSIVKEAREGCIEFRCGERSIKVNITQDSSPYIALEKYETAIDGDGGVISVLYISNADVDITTDDDWIRLIDPGNEDKRISLEVLRNMSSARTGQVRVTSKADREYYKTLTVSQGEKIDHPSVRFEEGYSMDISERTDFTLHPIFEDMTDTALIWSSDYPDIASVDQNGNVRIHTSGQCTISAKNALHNVTAYIALNIRIKATGIHVYFGEQDMDATPLAVRFPGEVMHIRIDISPEYAYSEDIVCTSSDPSVAEVSGMEIRCIAPGSANIIVESLYNGLRKYANIMVLEN